jgi:putative salt-induced outer membrane protein YdiY
MKLRQATPEDGSSTPPSSAPFWRPLPPNPEDFDWIRLNSDEWLKGEIKGMRQRRLEFDSDKLKDLTFDWKDVVELRSPRENYCVFEGRITAIGTVHVRDDTVAVGGETEQYFPRSKLTAIVPKDKERRAFWTGKLGLGYSGRSGNTDQTDLNGSFSITRRTPFTRLEMDYSGAVSVVDGATNVNNHRATGKFDWFVGPRVYLTPLQVEAYQDKIQNIDLRLTPSAGVGYHLFDRSEFEWDVMLGGGYRWTRSTSVEADQNAVDGTAAVVGGTNLDLEVTHDVDFTLDYSAQVGVPATRDTNTYLSLALELEVTDNLDVDLGFSWSYVNNPIPDSNGVVPEKDDYRVSFGLGWNF